MTTRILTFLTIPPEIRSLIYCHIFDRVCITTGRNGLLDTDSFPYQITAVSYLVRAETLPLLHKGITLFCQSGHFPERTQRRLPNRILKCVSKIVILDDVVVDEIKPTLRSFPKLETFEIDVICYQGFRKFGLIKPRSSLDPVELFRECVLYVLLDLEIEMVMPREGLERDYLPYDSLYQIVKIDRARRGFDMLARQRAWADGDIRRDPRNAVITEVIL